MLWEVSGSSFAQCVYSLLHTHCGATRVSGRDATKTTIFVEVLRLFLRTGIRDGLTVPIEVGRRRIPPALILRAARAAWTRRSLR